MNNDKKKTDESVKAGLQIEADTNAHNNVDNNIPEAENEKDADDLVHERNNNVSDTNTNEELDADETVHLRNIDTATNAEDEETDIDDLMHKNS